MLGNKTVQGEENGIEKPVNENMISFDFKKLFLRFYCTEFQNYPIADLESCRSLSRNKVTSRQVVDGEKKSLFL